MLRFWKIIFSILATSLLFLVFSGLIDRWAFPDTNWDISGNGEKVEIKPGYPIIQKFEAGRNNLSRIRILFGRSYNKDAGEIYLKLTDESCKNIIEEKTFERSSIKSEGYYDFKFSKISDSKNRKFCLLVDFKPEKEKYKKLNMFISEKSASENQLFINEKEIKNGALAMRPAYEGDGLRGNMKELNQRISQYKPWFFKGVYLYAIFFLFVLLTIFFIFLIIWI
jgi:hypothetical protein